MWGAGCAAHEEGREDAQQRREGVFAGFYTTIEKGAGAIGIAITGLFLGAMGYVESSVNETATQPQTALLAIVLCMTVFPTVLTILSCLPLIKYDLSSQRLQQMARAHHHTKDADKSLL